MHCPRSQHISYDMCEPMCTVLEVKHISYDVCEHMFCLKSQCISYDVCQYMCRVPEVNVLLMMYVSTW